MPYDQDLDRRIREITATWQGSHAKKMFGGMCYLLNGNMVCGVYKEYLILRLGEAQARAALQAEDVSLFDITGRPMKGWVMVAPRGCADRKALADWLGKAKAFTAALPPK